jgi:pimeloyl-ACP methyl ester carboxylesterase
VNLPGGTHNLDVLERRWTLSRGCNLCWFREGSGPPVILIQGVGVAGTGWLPQVAALAREFTCLCFDNRGLGQSQPLDRPLTVELMAEDVIALMDAQGWAGAHVIGHSLGGLIAQYVARLAPPRVRSLVLLCTFATGAIPTRMSGRLLRIGLRTRVGTRRLRRHAFLELVLPPGAWQHGDRDTLARELGELFGHDLADAPAVTMKQFRAMRQGDARPFLPNIVAPTLVISAQHDPIAPLYAGRELARGIAGAQYIEMPDASHGVPIHQADRINALLLDFLRTVEARAGGP